MSSAVVLLNHAGYSLRAKALRDAHDRVFVATPDNLPNDHSVSVPIPFDWIQSDNKINLSKRCWFKADAMALAAARYSGIDSDYYWFIESDVVANQESWKQLFAMNEDNDCDMLSISIPEIESSFIDGKWIHSNIPSSFDFFSLLSIFRLSKQALTSAISMAPTMRECFGELALPYVIKANRLTHGLIDPQNILMDSGTMCEYSLNVKIHQDKINHPVKSNTYGVPIQGNGIQKILDLR